MGMLSHVLCVKLTRTRRKGEVSISCCMRSAPKTLNNKIPRPILIIPESIEHEDLDQPSKDHEELYEKAKEAKESQPAVTCTIRINGEEQRNLKLLNMDQSLNVQSQWPLHKHLVDYSDSFVSWIEYGQTCFL